RHVEARQERATHVADALPVEHPPRLLVVVRLAELPQHRDRRTHGATRTSWRRRTQRSGPKRLRDHFDQDEADVLLRRRFAIVNVWRSTRGRVRTAPIALCDASSVVPRDLVSVKREARDRIGEIQQAVYNPAHRWYYFPEMQPDEVLLIKPYDSATAGPPRFTLPPSFEDPTAAVDAEARESLETRCFAFF